jgi:hypothetical protein
MRSSSSRVEPAVWATLLTARAEVLAAHAQAVSTINVKCAVENRGMV